MGLPAALVVIESTGDASDSTPRLAHVLHAGVLPRFTLACMATVRRGARLATNTVSGLRDRTEMVGIAGIGDLFETVDPTSAFNACTGGAGTPLVATRDVRYENIQIRCSELRAHAPPATPLDVLLDYRTYPSYVHSARTRPPAGTRYIYTTDLLCHMRFGAEPHNIITVPLRYEIDMEKRTRELIKPDGYDVLGPTVVACRHAGVKKPSDMNPEQYAHVKNEVVGVDITELVLDAMKISVAARDVMNDLGDWAGVRSSEEIDDKWQRRVGTCIKAWMDKYEWDTPCAKLHYKTKIDTRYVCFDWFYRTVTILYTEFTVYGPCADHDGEEVIKKRFLYVPHEPESAMAV